MALYIFNYIEKSILKNKTLPETQTISIQISNLLIVMKSKAKYLKFILTPTIIILFGMDIIFIHGARGKFENQRLFKFIK